MTSIARLPHTNLAVSTCKKKVVALYFCGIYLKSPKTPLLTHRERYMDIYDVYQNNSCAGAIFLVREPYFLCAGRFSCAGAIFFVRGYDFLVPAVNADTAPY